MSSHGSDLPLLICACGRAAAICGQGIGIAAWLVECHIEFKELNTTTLQQIGPALTGGCFSLFISLILVIVLSFFVPQNYDWRNMRSILVYSDISHDKRLIAKEESIEALNRAERIIWIWAIVLSCIFLFGWPLLALPAGVWSKGYFTFYIVLSFVWALVAAFLALTLPIFESRFIIYAVLGGTVPGCSFLKTWAEAEDLGEDEGGETTGQLDKPVASLPSEPDSVEAAKTDAAAQMGQPTGKPIV